jgi:hypothetical protein
MHNLRFGWLQNSPLWRRFWQKDVHWNLAFQNEEDMQEPTSADEKATGAGAFPREINTMPEVFGIWEKDRNG